MSRVWSTFRDWPGAFGKFIGVINLFLAFGLLYLYLSKDIAHPSDGWNWTDFITILLGTVTIVLAALGTLIAVAALWGYQQIQKSAELRSVEAVDRLLHSDEFERKVEGIIASQLEKSEVQKAVEDGIAVGSNTEQPEKDWED